MAKHYLKAQVAALRKSGMSIRDISKELKLSKSTISLWCKQIHLSVGQTELLRRKQIAAGSVGRMLGAESNRLKKVRALEAAEVWARNIIPAKLNRESITALVAALYWAEGSKADSSAGFLFVNSDPGMIKLVFLWLTRDAGVAPEDISVTVMIDVSHKSRIGKVLNFWSSLLGLPQSAMRKPYFIGSRPKKAYLNRESYYGTLRLRVHKSSQLKYNMLAVIEKLKNMPV